MAIDYDSFLNWVNDKFNSDVVVRNKDICINSIFTYDNGHHMWCSPSGGKHRREDGVYRCFKTDKKGTLVGLVMEVDNCGYEEAKDVLSGNTAIGLLEEKLKELLQEREQKQEPVSKIKLPENTHLITSLPHNDYLRNKAENYLKSRKLPADGLYVSASGDYKNRIIIPYYDREGKLIYFNGRTLSAKGLRYLGPDKSIGVGKGDVIYAPKWPKKGEKVYLTEGELDALTLSICGLNGMACGGKYLSDKQVELIKDYKICLALDEDHAGFSGILEMSNKLFSKQISNITFVRPAQGFKDWNKMLVSLKPEILVAWVAKHEKPFDEWTENSLLTNLL